MNHIKSFSLLTLLCLILYVPGIASIPMMDRDSAHFAQATKQMLQSNNFFQIRFQQRTRFQKPPGINWLQALSVHSFSDKNSNTAWPYRVPSLLGGLLSVLFTFAFARRFVGSNAALWGAGLLACSLLLVVESHLAVIDASLLSSVVLMQGALWIIYDSGLNQRRCSWFWPLIFWLAMGYGFVLKGVTPLVGFLTIISLSILDRQTSWLRGLRFHWGLPLLLLTMIWLVFVNQAEGTNYLLKMVQKDLLPKLKGGHESHGQPPLFHLAILPLTFWPASLFLWPAAIRGYKFRRHGVEKFLLCWILPTWVFFELMPTKLPQYVLPTFPAIALLAGLAISNFKQLNLKHKHIVLLNALIVLWFVFSLCLAAGLFSIPYLLKLSTPVMSYVLFIAIAIFTVTAMIFALRQNLTKAAMVTILGALLSYGLLYQYYLPNIKPLWISQNIVSMLGDNGRLISDDKPLLVIGYAEPSLVYSLNTKQVSYVGGSAAIDVLQANNANLILVEQTYFESLKHLAKAHHIQLAELFRVHGMNYSKGKWLTLIVLRKDTRA